MVQKLKTKVRNNLYLLFLVCEIHKKKTKKTKQKKTKKKKRIWLKVAVIKKSLFSKEPAKGHKSIAIIIVTEFSDT